MQYYYDYSPEAIRIALTRPDLLELSMRMSEEYLPYLHELLATGSCELPAGAIEEIGALLDDFAREGNADFQAAVHEVWPELATGDLLRRLGIRQQEVEQ